MCFVVLFYDFSTGRLQILQYEPKYGMDALQRQKLSTCSFLVSSKMYNLLLVSNKDWIVSDTYLVRLMDYLKRRSQHCP